eukprot:SAG31_NODE_589_length_13808_cov_3.896710_13_plen_155_part_00
MPNETMIVDLIVILPACLAQAMDRDGSNSIDVSEISELFKEIEFDMDEKKITEIISDMDRDDDKTLTFDEFRRWWIESKTKSEEEVQDNFGIKTSGHKAARFGALDLDSEWFRRKIDNLAAEARLSNSTHNSTARASSFPFLCFSDSITIALFC